MNKAILHNARLQNAIFDEVDVNEADFANAILGNTKFVFVELIKAHGLEDIYHQSPSNVSVNTIQKSNGVLPEKFLRGCGLSDWEIEWTKLYKPDLSNDEINSIIYKIFDLRANQSIQISPLFISYSHEDSAFVEKLESHLTNKGVRFWRDIHNATSGRLETQIDRAMKQNPTVLLILSQNSVKSDWVEHEVRMARALEKEMGRDVLCPIALDTSWKDSRWPKRIMEQVMEYNILDFSTWKVDSKFGHMFRKLIDGLELFYKGKVL